MVFRFFGIFFTGSSFLLAVGIVIYLLYMSAPAFTEVGFGRFFSDTTWYPDANGEGTFGLFPMVVASLLVAGVSIIFAIPVALTIVLYAEYFASWPQQVLFRRTVEVLGAIPSVVYGLIGVSLIVPVVNSLAAPGTSLIAAIFVLVPMIVPTAALFYFSATEGLSQELPKVAASLNLSRVRFVGQVVMPSIHRQVVSGGLLAFARALGETMAVLMVAGNVIQIPGSIFDPVRLLTANIALEMGYARGVHRSALFFTGLVMVCFVIVLLVLSEGARHFSKKLEVQK
ncbi:MAG: ABC transporter permease subunit [bacterium]|nr:ABC transporter permease subunit [bacterium]